MQGWSFDLKIESLCKVGVLILRTQNISGFKSFTRMKLDSSISYKFLCDLGNAKPPRIVFTKL
jgi:hypothetical protein